MFISTIEQNQILEILEELPPDSYSRYCVTEDQHYWLISLKIGYLYLKDSFIDFFTGQADSSLYELDPNQREFMFLCRDWYLALYKLIQGNWHELKNTIPLDTPGDALIKVIQGDCAAFFSPATQPYYRWTPSEARKLAKSDREISQMEALGELGSKAAQSKLKTYNSTLNKHIKPIMQYIGLREVMLDICKRAKKGTVTQRHYVEYKRIQSELDRRIQAELHPSKHQRGHEWKNGKIRGMGTSGGF